MGSGANPGDLGPQVVALETGERRVADNRGFQVPCEHLLDLSRCHDLGGSHRRKLDPQFAWEIVLYNENERKMGRSIFKLKYESVAKQ